MKVLILSRGIPSKRDPQEGCFELDQAKALKEAGHDVVIMAVDSRVRKFWRTPGIKKDVIDGIKTYRLFTFPTSVIRHIFSFKIGINIEAQEALMLYKYITKREGAFDLIHAHFLSCIYYADFIKKKLKIPIIGTEHWSKVDSDINAPDVQYMGGKVYQNLERLITVSNSLRERILTHFNVDSKMIHNLIDTSYLQPLNNKKRKDFTIVLVGSLIKRKGFDFFIKAFGKSKLVGKNISVKIIGGGPEYQNLTDLISTLNLSKQISLEGQQSKNIIFKELEKAKIFVLPSRSENFSVSVLEALANGLPVIATICGGIRECIGETNGLLVEVDNEDQMVKALENMYDNYEKYDRQKIREECLSLYSPQSIAQQINEVYNSVIKKDDV